MIEAHDLGVTFPGGTEALKGINVKIDDGELIAVIGLSGAGKSTFLRTLNGLVKPTKGEVIVGGVNVGSLSGYALQRFRRTVGFIFQQFNLVNRLSAMDNVLHGRIGYLPTWRGLMGLYGERDYALAAAYLDEVGLAEKKDARVDALSGGQQQRVAIARAMAQEPQLVLADEPMASLDPRLSDVILGLLKSYNESRGVTVLVNIHVLELARRYAQRVLAFNQGRLVFDGPVDELTGDLAEQIYAGSLEAL